MTKEELIKKLEELDEGPEENHQLADRALLDYIDDPDIRKAWQAIGKWFA